MDPTSAPPRERDQRSLYSLAQIQHLLRVEFDRGRRYRYPVTCMLIAVDRLGHLRDVHGYETKERIVAAVVAMLMDNMRSSDFLGRTSDDGLMAIIPHTPPDGLQFLAQRLVSEAGLLTVDAGGKRVAVSISVGMAHNQQGDPMYSDALLRGAEGALRAALERGGSCWVERPPA
jgi:diguanylate cyclase (GGDEF)-like protein